MNEVYPSVYRGIGVGLSSVLGRLGTAIAPFVTNFLS